MQVPAVACISTEVRWDRRGVNGVARAKMAAELDLAAVEVYTVQEDRPLRLSHADVGLP